MKKVFMLVAVVAALVATSCGSQKKMMQMQMQMMQMQQGGGATNSPVVSPDGMVEVAKNRCEILANEPSENMRALGVSGKARNLQGLRPFALADAQRELTMLMQASVEGAVEIYNSSVQVEDRIATSSSNVANAVSLFAQDIKNCKILDVITFTMKEGDATYYQMQMCVEMLISQEEVADKIYDKLASEDEVLRVNFERENFKKGYAQSLQEYKERQAQQ